MIQNNNKNDYKKKNDCIVVVVFYLEVGQLKDKEEGGKVCVHKVKINDDTWILITHTCCITVC